MQHATSSPVIRVEEEGLTKQPQARVIPDLDTLKRSDLQFNKLQHLDEDINQDNKYFGEFVAREAVLDEEYWTAAWLRAESHWEDRPNERYAESYKRKFADQEYNALKRRCRGYHGQRSTCLITVKKEDKNVKNTILKSVVGTLDLSIRYLSQGESFPGERVQAPLFCSIERKEASRYGYVANLCVAKSARRKGIAINMLKFAIQSAKLKGADMIFVHVHRKNTPAQELYSKLGFEMVDVASLQLVEEQMYLLCCKT
ncbi:uncharacterized protein LOC104883459 isoform X2 [Beta vulgaris subsp. vulgaris]|uniref:uncharacterized protein LOC104883459 isoform X2 n=1 Tax=Beta vulgaris subsp. vulgaris TaxID=3555 RepID=UPI0020375D65|nr:uncharacterized protein LOC104883459 isoform X2 [Beta vulgaris subsp. vulgaris]